MKIPEPMCTTTVVTSNSAWFSSFSMKMTLSLFIGRSGINTGFLDGRTDEVKIYNRALSETKGANKYSYYLTQ